MQLQQDWGWNGWLSPKLPVHFWHAQLALRLLHCPKSLSPAVGVLWEVCKRGLICIFSYAVA